MYYSIVDVWTTLLNDKENYDNLFSVTYNHTNASIIMSIYHINTNKLKEKNVQNIRLNKGKSDKDPYSAIRNLIQHFFERNTYRKLEEYDLVNSKLYEHI